MKILVSGSESLIKHFGPAYLGGLITPQSYRTGDRYLSLGAVWAMDNDCFKGLKRTALTKMWRANQPFAKTCLWATVPDVVGDAEATLERFAEWGPIVKGFGFPIAFVAQDGIENINIPWDKLDCLFIGGTTQFKIDLVAAYYVQEAKERGKWVHMGRVSTPKRLHLAGEWGCDSVDSTAFSRTGMKLLPEAIEIVKLYSTQLEKGA